jgi:hypothetical protein
MIELWKAIPTSTSSEIWRRIIINLEFGRILKSDSLFRETRGSEGMLLCKSLEKEKWMIQNWMSFIRRRIDKRP